MNSADEYIHSILIESHYEKERGSMIYFDPSGLNSMNCCFHCRSNSHVQLISVYLGEEDEEEFSWCLKMFVCHRCHENFWQVWEPNAWGCDIWDELSCTNIDLTRNSEIRLGKQLEQIRKTGDVTTIASYSYTTDELPIEERRWLIPQENKYQYSPLYTCDTVDLFEAQNKWAKRVSKKQQRRWLYDPLGLIDYEPIPIDNRYDILDIEVQINDPLGRLLASLC